MSDYEPFNIEELSDEEKRKRELSKLEDQQAIADMKFVMSDPRGRRFIFSQLARTGVFKSSYTGDNETFFREGMRNTGIRLLDDLKTHCDELYLTMERERINDRRKSGDASQQQ